MKENSEHREIRANKARSGPASTPDVAANEGPIAVGAGTRESVRQSERTRPRLGLAQMLIWVTCIAACLAIVKGLVPQDPSPLGIAVVLPHVVAVGTAWAGLVILALRSTLDSRWTVGPGHWLLGLLGAVFSVELVLRFVPSTSLSRPDVVLNAVTCWLFVLPLFSRHLAARWTAFFGLIVFLYAAPLVLGCLAILGLWAAESDSRLATILVFAKTPAAIGAVLTTCQLDRRDGVRHDWLDWCGIAVFLWAMAYALIERVWT
jgi:hypothetical protein